MKRIYTFESVLDVVIVGGGVSGLYAAYLLQQKGLKVQVIEGSARLGGRLQTIYTPEGHPVDLGGQWIAPQHTRLLNWIKVHRIPIHPTYTTGANLLITRNRRRRYHGSIPRLSALALLDLGWGLARLKRMARHVSPQSPWQISRPAWDEISLATWMRKQFYTKEARKTFAVGLSTVLGCEPEEVSLWHTLFYIQSAGSLEVLIQTQGGAQEMKFSQGAQTLVETLSSQVSWVIDEPVRRIIWERRRVQVYTTKHHYDARVVLLAIPPALTGHIGFEPPLPPSYSQLAQHMPMGSVTKVVALYDKPFWREEGLSGHILRLEGGVRVTFDTSPADGSYGQITGFGVGPNARSLLRLSPEERQAYYEAELHSLFGVRPQRLYYKVWAEEPLIGGCYAGYFTPGGWRYFGESMRRSLPPLYWCGTERSSTWAGYIEGAMAAAEQATEDLLQVI
ncbi:MAG: FAD-dependent oxidoreductase [Bacteroidia bacterium]|nr:FAD-dependent oxidoreductase [Bacteroidia bacterium]